MTDLQNLLDQIDRDNARTQANNTGGMRALRDWLGFPDASWRGWLVGMSYTLFFLALFFIGGGH